MAVAVGLKAEEAGAGLWLTLGFVNFRTAHRCYRPLHWMAKGRVVGSKLMVRLIGRVVATVKAVGVPALPLRYGAIEYTVSVPVAPQNRDFICY
jgi:hypothetical protein